MILFNIVYSFADALMFQAYVFVIAYWSIFIMAALKPLSSASNIFVILVLASIDYLFFFYSVWDLPGSWYGEWFSFETWIVLYYVIRFSISFKPSILTGFVPQCSGRSERAPTSLMPDKYRSPGSPLSLQWNFFSFF